MPQPRASPGRGHDRTRSSRPLPLLRLQDGNRSYPCKIDSHPISRHRSCLLTPSSIGFMHRLIERGVIPPGYRPASSNKRLPGPQNRAELEAQLYKDRTDVSPPPEDVRQTLDEFRNDYADALRAGRASEAQIMNTVLPHILGSNDHLHTSGRNMHFNLEKFDDDFSAPQPDLTYGQPAALVDEEVRTDLHGYIVPSTGAASLTAPNFFLEAKGRSVAGIVAEDQSVYNAAVGARGMFHLQNYQNDSPVYDGNAYSMAAKLHDGQLTIYAAHPVSIDQLRAQVASQPDTPVVAPPPQFASSSSSSGYRERPILPSLAPARGASPRRPSPATSWCTTNFDAPDNNGYVVTVLDAFSLKGNQQAFVEGVKAYRNARDWTSAKRTEFLTDANRRAHARREREREREEDW